MFGMRGPSVPWTGDGPDERVFWHDTDLKAQGWWSNMYRQTVPRATDEFTTAMLRILDRLATGNLSTSTLAVGKRTKTVL